MWLVRMRHKLLEELLDCLIEKITYESCYLFCLPLRFVAYLLAAFLSSLIVRYEVCDSVLSATMQMLDYILLRLAGPLEN